MENEVVEKIIQIKNAIESRNLTDWTDEELYRAMTKLAIYNMTLGGIVASAELDFNLKYNMRKVSMAKDSLSQSSSGASFTKSELTSEVNSERLRNEEAQAKYTLTMLKNLYEDSKTMITVLQSRLRQLNTESIQSSRTPNVL